MSDRVGEVSLLSATAAALDSLDIVEHVGRVNVSMETMAWLWFVLREVPDNERDFPAGKWATLQEIERQLMATAKQYARDAVSRKPPA